MMLEADTMHSLRIENSKFSWTYRLNTVASFHDKSSDKYHSLVSGSMAKKKKQPNLKHLVPQKPN